MTYDLLFVEWDVALKRWLNQSINSELSIAAALCWAVTDALQTTVAVENDRRLPVMSFLKSAAARTQWQQSRPIVPAPFSRFMEESFQHVTGHLPPPPDICPGRAPVPPQKNTIAVVAQCAPTPMTWGSCSCREHTTNSVIGVSRPPVLDCGTTFHLDHGGRDLPSTPSERQSLKTHLFGDRSARWLFWMYRRYINKFIRLSIYLYASWL